MFERFTDRARRVVVLAQEEARMLNHNHIGTEHLLLGLAHEGEAVAAIALAEHGVSVERARKVVEEVVGIGQQAPKGHVPFTPFAKTVMERSLREALQLNHNYIGTEHILLGLLAIEDGNIAIQVLKNMGVSAELLRNSVKKLLFGAQRAAAADAEQVDQGTVEATEMIIKRSWKVISILEQHKVKPNAALVARLIEWKDSDA